MGATTNNIERRVATGGVEIRKSAESNTYTLRGYAFRFGSVYDMGEFTEEVVRSAFDGVDSSDVRILDNHLSDKILGRTKSGTARVGIDEHGGWYEVDLPDSPNGNNMRASVERGDIDQSSWGFILSDKGDKWERRNGKLHRQLTGVSHWLDASPVTFPANPDTSIAKRSMIRCGHIPVETREEGTQKPDKYELSYILNIVFSSIYWTNDQIYSLNNCIENCKMFLGENVEHKDLLEKIIADCEAAKQALVVLINSQADSAKALNSHENREQDPPKKKSRALDDADFRLREMQLSQ